MDITMVFRIQRRVELLHVYFFSTQSIISQSKDGAFWFVYVGGHGPVLRVCVRVCVCVCPQEQSLTTRLGSNQPWLFSFHCSIV